MAETFLICIVGIITIVITLFIYCLMAISSMCDKEEEKWRKRKKRK